MPKIISREQNPIPGVDYSEIHIPDEDSLGTGTFTTVLEPDAMVKNNPIISTIINEPVFQLIVNIDIDTHEVTVLLGKADNTPPLSRKVFTIPEDVNSSVKNSFKITFEEWKITGLELNEEKLQEML